MRNNGEQETTACKAGQEESMKATTSSDRVCKPCPTNSWKDNAGQQLGGCKTQPSCGAGMGITNAGDAKKERVCGDCGAGQFQSLVTGVCSKCILGASFALGDAPTKCTWVNGVSNVKLTLTYKFQGDAPANFANTVKSTLRTKVAGQGTVVSVTSGGNRRTRRGSTVVLNAVVSTDAYESLVVATWMDKGGLDIDDATFDRRSLKVTGPADQSDQPNPCTVITEATLTSDRDCEEMGGMGILTTEGASTKGASRSGTTNKPNAGDDDDDDDGDGDIDKAKKQLAKKKEEDNTMLIVIIAVVVVLLVFVAIGAFVYISTNTRQAPNLQMKQAFNNPMYDSGQQQQQAPQGQNPNNGQQGKSGYMDVNPNYGGGDPTYAEPVDPGYMEVSDRQGLDQGLEYAEGEDV